MSVSIFILLAGLMGAAGVALAAAAAHVAPGAGLDSGGYFLLFHAPAAVVLAWMSQQGYAWHPFGYVAAAGLVAGASLFAGDLALRALAGHRLFAMAAPTGGVILIMSWLLAGAAALVALWRHG